MSKVRAGNLLRFEVAQKGGESTFIQHFRNSSNDWFSYSPQIRQPLAWMWSSFVVLQPPSDCHCSTLSSRGWWSQQTQGDHHHNCHRHHCHHHHKPLKMKAIILVFFVAHRKTRSSCRSQQYDEWHKSLAGLAVEEKLLFHFGIWVYKNQPPAFEPGWITTWCPISPGQLWRHQPLPLPSNRTRPWRGAASGWFQEKISKITITSSRRPADLLAVGDDICLILTYYSVKHLITFQL